MELTTTASLSSPDVLRALEANVAMIRFDRQRRVVDVNDLFAKAMKYKRDEMIGIVLHAKFRQQPRLSSILEQAVRLLQFGRQNRAHRRPWRFDLARGDLYANL